MCSRLSIIDTAIVVDLDFTLINTNTTFEFMKLLCPLRYTIFSRLLKPVSLLNVVFKKDLYKLTMTLICLKGRKKEDLERSAKIYYERIIKENYDKYYNNQVLALLQANKYKIKVLMTASLDFIADNFKELGFNFILASKTHYKDGKFYFFSDLYKQKNRIARVFLKYLSRLVVIDDDPEPELYTLNKKVIVMKVSK